MSPDCGQERRTTSNPMLMESLTMNGRVTALVLPVANPLIKWAGQRGYCSHVGQFVCFVNIGQACRPACEFLSAPFRIRKGQWEGRGRVPSGDQDIIIYLNSVLQKKK